MKPADVNIVYNNTSSLTGAGQTVAVYGVATPTTADLTGYLSAVNSTQTLSNYTVVSVDGGSNSTDQTNGYHEAAGDTENVLGLAPGAKVRLYAVANALYTSSLGDVLAQVINDQKTDKTITVLTISMDGVEGEQWNQAVITPFSQQFAQLAAAGVTVCVASGDGGSNPNPQAGSGNYYLATAPLAVMYPASDPNVTGVGGTVLDFNNTTTVAPITWTWNEVTTAPSGGGISGIFDRPSWQTGPGVPAGTKRCVPDVSIAYSAYYIFENGAYNSFGGTSASAPAFAAYVALFNQARASAGKAPLGLLGPSIYPYLGTAAFNDITQSDPEAIANGGTPGNGAYLPGPGYDLCSGVGSPNFNNLLTVLTGGTLPTSPPPTVNITQAANQTVANGSVAITLISQETNASYVQWYLNGVAIPNAGNTTLVVDPTAATEGHYTVTATNMSGTASADAGSIVVTTDAWIVNLSARVYAETGANLLIAGFVTTGPDNKALLIRGDGPALKGFGITDALMDPKLTLDNNLGNTLATTTTWSTTLDPVFTQVGAFTLTPGSGDTALLESLPASAYTALVVSQTTNNGVALAEIYDADSLAPTDRLVNISARAFVGTGGNILIGGFVIGGNTPQTVVIRGDGPALAEFGLTGALSNTTLTLSNSTGAIVTNTGWGNPQVLTSLGVQLTFSNPYVLQTVVIQPLTAALSAKVGAFALAEGSNDSAFVATLPPGAYTVQLAGTNGSTGIALVEIYELR
jgi:hypothetical protein